MTNMRGDFYLRRGEPLGPVSGGHAVGLVGYSDTFRSEAGYLGGWIIKNSWWDGLPPLDEKCTDPTAPCHSGRGSHTLGYYMQEISEPDEADICPNSQSPRSWYPCATLEACNAPETALFARSARKALHLQCLERSPYAQGWCTVGERIFLKNLTA